MTRDVVLPPNPRVIVDATRIPTLERGDTRVVKIVVGPAPSADEGIPAVEGSLGIQLATPFPNLTHLYLWRVDGLRHLPELPKHLVCLDLRGCRDLEALPPLPDTLRVLDLGDCAKLI